MDTGRLEAFSDGVIAIIITITVLLIKPPKGDALADLKELIPLVRVYTVSFIMIGTNWANHHQLMKITDTVDGKIIWANHFYLFTLSFYPVATAWVGKTNLSMLPTVVYVIVNLIESLAFIGMERLILKEQSVAESLEKGRKERATVALEIAALIVALNDHIRFMAYILLLIMTLLWIIPDLRMQKTYEQKKQVKDAQ